MYVVAGLGNPGKRYEKTRHNMGFLLVDQLAADYNIKINKIKHKALLGEGVISGEKVLLVKPQTFMNLSGESIREVIDYYKVPVNKLIVIYDDMDLETGTLRIRKKGSAGSHNGMKSVIYQLADDAFPRIRIGIGNSGGIDWKNFVCGKLDSDETAVLAESIHRASEAVECIISEGIDIAMNRFNSRKKNQEEQDKEEDAKGND